MDGIRKIYHLLHIRIYRKKEKFTFSQQIAFEKDQKHCVPNFWKSCNHESI